MVKLSSLLAAAYSIICAVYSFGMLGLIILAALAGLYGLALYAMVWTVVPYISLWLIWKKVKVVGSATPISPFKIAAMAALGTWRLMKSLVRSIRKNV